MARKGVFWQFVGSLFIFGGLLVLIVATPAETAVVTEPASSYHQTNSGRLQTISSARPAHQTGECAIYAVEAIGAWVEAGAAEGQFPFESMDGVACQGDFEVDILPLFSQDNAWFEGSEACTNCHFDNSEDSRHEMDLSNLDGILKGADVLSEPPGVPIIEPGDWENSVLRARLRNNRMPPGWEFDIEETNRDGPLLELDGAEIYAVDLIAAWVDSGAVEGEFPWSDTEGADHTADFEADVLSLFNTENAWFDGSEACTNCHFDNSEDSRHEMDLSSLDGILAGADVLSEPPGVAIVAPGDWEHSKLRARLRNNRMPPGWEFDIEETNRDGPVVLIGVIDVPATGNGDCAIYAVDAIGAWVEAGAAEGQFPFESMDGVACQGDFEVDILPLFSQDNAWFEGSEACTNCHFDNSEDSRHEMDLSNLDGILKGADVLSEPPGVPIVVPGDWENSVLRARLRNNRMPPGWEFDIEETNRDGPLLELDGAEIYAVDLIAAWVDSGAVEGEFPWSDTEGTDHTADFEADVLSLFNTENAWFDGSEACTNCHFDNSEDSRHEMDLSSLDGIMKGGDVLSEPPGVAIVLPGDWEHSKLRARLRNNRMPPGWEFDIEETNRDGPVVLIGILDDSTTGDGDCDIYAVDAIGAWVEAGAAEGPFAFESINNESCQGDFEKDILPLFSVDNTWFEGSEACTNCHFDNSEDSRHEMDLSNLDGILKGADVLSEPPGVPIIEPGDWENSVLRARLRNNRMPPGWEFDIEETNRDGPLLELDGAEIYAVDLIAAWVDSGAAEGEFPWIDMEGADHTADFEADVLSLFNTENAWFEGSEACTNCHFDNSEDSRHEMDLSSLDGIMKGGDVLSEPPGVAIVLPGDWEHSKLRARLRNNRMPPGWEFDVEETNRDGPIISIGNLPDGSQGPAAGILNGQCDVYAVDLIGAWVDAGATEGEFPFDSSDGIACLGDFVSDVLPLFNSDDAWFAGSESCTNCHFDNSEDSRHEMDLSSLDGIMKGGDVLSEPPGVAIVLPGDWENSNLRARLRNNRMPPGWEFDIEETNRDGPLLELDGAEIYAVDLIAAWVDSGAAEGEFPWSDTDGADHTADFEADVLSLFNTENAWFEGSEACTNCHFDNSEDSRHEMDLSSLDGIMKGGDVLSEPPGVAIVVPGDWEHSKLRARLRNNRMPPGWEFDIEETNRDGPMVSAGVVAAGNVDGAQGANTETTEVDQPVSEIAPPPLPEPTVTEMTTTDEAETAHIFLVIFGAMTLVSAVVVIFVFGNRLRNQDREADNVTKAADWAVLLFAIVAIVAAGLLLTAVTGNKFTKTVTTKTTVVQPVAVEVAPVIPIVAEERLQEWQARIPEAYASLENPFAGDTAAAQAGAVVFNDNDCVDCHGDMLQGDGEFSPGLRPKPVNLTDPALMSLPFMTDAYLYWRVSEGGVQSPFYSAMPAWRHMIPEEQRWQLVSFIRSQVASENIDEGEQAAIAIIERGGCFGCHRLEYLGRGGKIGPAWDQVGINAMERVPGLSAEEYIRQSILEPQSFTVSGFEEATLMPANFGDLFSPEEIDILVAFLSHLPEEPGEYQ